MTPVGEAKLLQSTSSSKPIAEKRQYPRNKWPVLSIVLTLLGDLVYLGWGIGLFIGFAANGVFTSVTTVLFISTVGVIGCAALLGARPMMHRVWGSLVIVFTALAILVDGPALVGSFAYGVSIVGPTAYLGLILWSIPIALVLIGGGLAIIWKPPQQVSNT